MIKESGEDCINKCLKSIKDGRKFIDHSLSETMCESFSDEKELQQKINDYNRLSEREQEIIRLLLQGKSMKEIAFILNISYKTVSSHKTRIYAKLGIKGDLDLVRFAKKIRLIAKELDES